MPLGLKLPIAVGTRGGARTVEGFEARRQNILLGVYPASSLHPWHQRLTPPEETIFDIADEMTGGQLVAHIYQFFAEQERLGLTRLPRDSSGLRLNLVDADKGDVEIAINYIDLEDNATREVRFGRGRRG